MSEKQVRVILNLFTEDNKFKRTFNVFGISGKKFELPFTEDDVVNKDKVPKVFPKQNTLYKIYVKSPRVNKKIVYGALGTLVSVFTIKHFLKKNKK